MKGFRAQIWDYVTSHSTLRLKLDKSPNNPCTVFYMKDCDIVMFHSSWTSADIQVSSYDGEYGIRYIVQDGDRLRVDCGAIFLSKEFPSYSHIPGSFSDVHL